MTIRLSRVPGIAWVGVLVAALVLLGAVGIGRAAARRVLEDRRLASADSVRSVAGRAVAAARLAQAPADARARRDSATRDSTMATAAQLAARRDAARRALAEHRASFTLRGDSAVIDGHATADALPAEVAATLRAHDVEVVETQRAEAAHARSDSITLALLADRVHQVEDRDRTIAADSAQIAADSILIDALRDAKRSRIGFAAGVAVGATTALVAVGIVAKVLSLLR